MQYSMRYTKCKVRMGFFLILMSVSFAIARPQLDERIIEQRNLKRAVGIEHDRLAVGCAFRHLALCARSARDDPIHGHREIAAESGEVDATIALR